MTRQNTNLMVDLETLGTRPGCAILTIAAVPFASPHAVEPFYLRISTESSLQSGFHTDDATVAWWGKQSAEARDEAMGGTLDVKSALYAFSEYCNHLPYAPIVWGNGANFDNAILAEAYKIVGMKQPWKYTDDRCYRTLKELYPHIPYIKPKVAHHAFQDALAQAEHAARIFEWIRGRAQEKF